MSRRRLIDDFVVKHSILRDNTQVQNLRRAMTGLADRRHISRLLYWLIRLDLSTRKS